MSLRPDTGPDTAPDARPARPHPAGGPPVISLRGVSVGYEDVPAVSGVDLTISLGDVVALIGPNGSGKSTLVKGILGLAPVLAGSIEVFGEPVRGADRRRIGYVPQRHTIGGAIPSTVEEVVSSGRLVHRRWYQRAGAADRAAVADAIDAVGLADRRRAMVGTLSGGQQRRVLIARALARQPDALVMDEPTAGVDAANQEALTRTLMSLVGRGLTLLVVTHEITALQPVLTRVVAMDGGRLVSDSRLLSAGIETGSSDCHHDSPSTAGEGSRGSQLPPSTPLFLGPEGREG